jgi:hypothetical protein
MMSDTPSATPSEIDTPAAEIGATAPIIDRLHVMDPKDLVAAVRAAARRHNLTWEALVPDRFQVDFAHEAAEELAYAEMAAAKSALRDHICETYGLTVRELASLAAA